MMALKSLSSARWSSISLVRNREQASGEVLELLKRGRASPRCFLFRLARSFFHAPSYALPGELLIGKAQTASDAVGTPVDTNQGMVAQRFRITADGGDHVDGCLASRHGDVINEPRPLPSWVGNIPRRNLKTQLV